MTPDEVARLREDRRLIAKHPKDAMPDELKRMRELAGLSLGQAAKVSGIQRERLIAFEAGATFADYEEANALSQAYGCGIHD